MERVAPRIGRVGRQGGCLGDGDDRLHVGHGGGRQPAPLHGHPARSARRSAWTTWPIPIRVDGSIVRYAHVGLRSGATSKAVLTLGNLTAGKHRIEVGEGSQTTVVVP